MRSARKRAYHGKLIAAVDHLKQQLALKNFHYDTMVAANNILAVRLQALIDGGSAGNLVSAVVKQCQEAEAAAISLKDQLEVERGRLAACGIAALGYFISCDEQYKSASLEDTLRMRGQLDSLIGVTASDQLEIYDLKAKVVRLEGAEKKLSQITEKVGVLQEQLDLQIPIGVMVQQMRKIAEQAAVIKKLKNCYSMHTGELYADVARADVLATWEVVSTGSKQVLQEWLDKVLGDSVAIADGTFNHSCGLGEHLYTKPEIN